MRKQMPVLFMCLIFATVATGCWDRVEIDRRGFVVGAAIDYGKDGSGKKTHRIVYQYVVPSALNNQSSSPRGGGGGGGGGGAGAYKNVISDGEGITEAERAMAAKVSRIPFLEHMKVIVISEDIAREEKLSDVLDFFIRDNEARRSTKVFISEGEAAPNLEISSTVEKLPAVFIDLTSENVYRSREILPSTRLGKVQEMLLEKQSRAIQRISSVGGRDMLKGAAIVNIESKLVGFLNGEETSGLNFMTGDIRGGVVKFKYKNWWIYYEIKEAKRKIHVKFNDDEHIQFTISVESEGYIAELQGTPDLLDEKVIAEMEQGVEEEIDRIMMEAVRRLQNDMQVDAIGLGVYLEQEHYKTWRRIKDDWEQGRNLFSTSDIHIDTKVNIVLPGNVNKDF
jgi:spore germination protein